MLQEATKQLNPPNKISRPGILSEDRTLKAIQGDIKEIERRIKILKDRLERIFKEPRKYDPVYKVVQRIFNKKDNLNMTRQIKEKDRIRREAWKRFLYGYPPRKKNDTSIGDAINWEWIVEVASQNNADIVIVSRDSDYGITFEDKSYLNDWLLHEFKDRTSRLRDIRLSIKLSDTLKEFQVVISKEEEDWEDKLIALPSFNMDTFSKLQTLLGTSSSTITSEEGMDSLMTLNFNKDIK